MSTSTVRAGLDTIREVLGLTLEEIARAVGVNYTTLYRWQIGATPNPGERFVSSVARLEELAAELSRALDIHEREAWLNSPASIFDGRSPREMLLEGRAETLLGALLSHRHILEALERTESVQQGFAELLSRHDLSLSKRAALALLDQQIDDAVRGMQTASSRASAAEAFERPPRVRIEKNSES
ncbi:MAG: hypothetical protein GEU90_18605 [Gemmatimonas sp.]|nr:hypothetical protein [Gemmatimonas sp.]